MKVVGSMAIEGNFDLFCCVYICILQTTTKLLKVEYSTRYTTNAAHIIIRTEDDRTLDSLKSKHETHLLAMTP